MCADLLLLGGGHANLPLIRQIPDIVKRGHSVTCVSLSPVHYYSGMGPGMLGGSYSPEQIRFPLREMVESTGGRFLQGRAVRINAFEKTVMLRNGDSVPYDVLSVNVGSTIAATVDVHAGVGVPGAPEVYRVKPIEQLVELRRTIRTRIAEGDAPRTVAVVGGGPAAVEVAANVQRLIREAGASAGRTAETRVVLITGRTVLPGFPRKAERLALRELDNLGIQVRPAERVERIDAEGLLVGNRHEPADIVALATGVVPSRIFSDSGLPLGEDGSLAVNENLQALGLPEIFGGGDCIWFTPRPLARAGVYAVRQGPVLVHNVIARLDRGPEASLKSLSPQRSYLLLLNLGDDTALFWRKLAGIHVVYRGKSAYRLKDRIDMAFMHRFGSEADRAETGAEGAEDR